MLWYAVVVAAWKQLNLVYQMAQLQVFISLEILVYKHNFIIEI